MSPLQNDRRFLLLGAVLAFGVFIFDLLSPLGIAGGVPYVAIVLITLWISGKRHTYYSGVIGSILTVAGFFLSPASDIPLSVVLTNRILAILGIWAGVFVILKYKKSYIEMLHSKQGLDALFYYATEGILVVNERGEIVMINPKAGELFGFKKEDLLGKNIETLLPARIREKHTRHRKNYHGKPYSGKMAVMSMEVNGKKNDGSEFPVEISLTHYKTEEGMFVVAFIIDITLRKQQEDLIKKSIAELKHYSDELRTSNVELENFAYITSHDLQEPLRKIQTFGTRIKSNDYSNLGDLSKDYLDRMLNASQRMQVLITDLLSFSRLTTRAKQFEKVDLNQVLGEVLSDLELTIDKSQSKIQISPLPVIFAEPTQMRQLFQNLLSNAIKFRKENENPVVRIYYKKNENLTNENNEYFDLFFEDNGIGFDEKYTDRIFNIFQRLEGVKYEGSGIGLAVCRKIAQRHGGDISVKSKIGEGTTFIVTLASSKVENYIAQPV